MPPEAQGLAGNNEIVVFNFRVLSFGVELVDNGVDFFKYQAIAGRGLLCTTQ